MNFILLINVKMPTIVGILTFMSRIMIDFDDLQPDISIDSGYYNMSLVVRKPVFGVSDQV